MRGIVPEGRRPPWTFIADRRRLGVGSDVFRNTSLARGARGTRPPARLDCGNKPIVLGLGLREQTRSCYYCALLLHVAAHCAFHEITILVRFGRSYIVRLFNGNNAVGLSSIGSHAIFRKREKRKTKNTSKHTHKKEKHQNTAKQTTRPNTPTKHISTNKEKQWARRRSPAAEGATTTTRTPRTTMTTTTTT